MKIKKEKSMVALKEIKYLVYDCKNWHKVWVIYGDNCWACAKRNGYPFFAQPDKNCKNYLISLSRNLIQDVSK